MMHRLSRVLPAGLVLAVGLSGCITSTTSSAPGTAPGGRSRTTPATEAGTVKKSSTEKAAAAKPLPDLGAAKEISGKDQDGKEFKLSDYRGKVVMLDFWAGW